MNIVALNRAISDHCPLMLETIKEDWGPKPFRSLDAWFNHLEFIKKVREEWSLLRECTVSTMLKMLRAPLKVWNKTRFGNIDAHINMFEAELTVLEKKCEDQGLDEVERSHFAALQSQLQLWYDRKEAY